MSRTRHGGGRPVGRPGFAEAGSTLLDLAIVLVLVGTFLALAYSTWQRTSAREQLRSGVSQVVSNLRMAEERAKSERAPYAVTFTAASSTYTIQRNGGGFNEHAELPNNVSPVSSAVVTFSAFGLPDAAYNITVQNAAGTRTAYVGAMGDIVYQSR